MDEQKQKQIDEAIKLLRGEKYVVRTPDDENNYLENHTKDAVNSKVREMFEMFTATVKESSGIEPQNNEKATDFAKRAFSEKNELLTTASEELNKYKDEQITKDDTLSQLNTQLKGVKEELKTARGEVENLKNQSKQEKFNAMLQASIDSAVESFRPKFKKMDERVLENNVQAEISKFRERYTAKELDGAIVFYDGDKPVLDSETGNMKGVSAILSEQLEYLIDAGRQQTGTGTQQSGTNGKDLVLPEAVKSKSQLIDWLVKEQKMDSNSDAFMDAYDKYGKDLPLNIKDAV